MREELRQNVERGRGATNPQESDSLEREAERRVAAQNRSANAKSAGRGQNGSRANLAADARAVRVEAQSGAVSDRGSTSGQVARRELVRGLARGRAGLLELSRDLAAHAKAERARVEIAAESGAANGLGSTSGRVGRREPVQVLQRDRADRLEPSRDLAADAKAALREAESGLGSTRRNGNRADRILAASLASGRLVDLRARRGNLSVLKAPSCGPRVRSSGAMGRRSHLWADEVRGRARAGAPTGAQEARRAGCRGRVAHRMKTEARKQAVEIGLLLHSEANA